MKIALVIPFFNEENRINSGEYLISLSQSVASDFFYVDDGSTDRTFESLQRISLLTGAKLLRLESNSGKGEAIREGMRRVVLSSKYSYVGFLDADGAFPVMEVKRNIALAQELLDAQNSLNIFISSRVKLSGRRVNRNPLRHYISRILITCIGFKIPNMPYDSQSGLKIFRICQLLEDSIIDPFKTRWFFDLELMSRLGMTKIKCIAEEPVNDWSDIRGSKIKKRHALRIAREVLIIRRILRKLSS